MKLFTYVDHAVDHLVPVAQVGGVEECVLQHLVDVPAVVMQAHRPATNYSAEYIYFFQITVQCRIYIFFKLQCSDVSTEYEL